MNKIETKKDWSVWIFLSAILSIFILWLGFWWWINRHIPNNEATRGQFGDKFGAINALFSGLAMAGVFTAVLLQRKELKQTQEEFKAQNETLRKERFENTFFQMVSLHIKIVENLSNHNKNELIKKDCFEKIYELFANYYHVNSTGTPYWTIENTQAALEEKEKLSHEQTIKQIRNIYWKFYHPNQHNLAHYHRNLYHVFKFIHLSKLNSLISENEANFYSGIIKAQLSTYELLLIFYNSWVEGLGYPNMRFLMDEYDILEHMDRGKLLKLITHYKVFEDLKVEKDPFIEEEF